MDQNRPATERCIKHGEDIVRLEGRIDMLEPKLDHIITLVTQTNGRVKALELARAQAEGMVLGGKLVWALFGTGIGSAIVVAITHIMKH